MTRLQRWWLPVLLQTALGLAAACGGDDDDDDVKVDGGSDASVPKDGGLDASAGDAAAGAVRVSNPLTSCTSASACTGTAPTCAASITFGPAPGTTVPYPGGGSICTATCTAAAECGTQGACPVGELLKALPAASALLGSTGYCSKTCTLGTPSSCPTGFACLTLELLGSQLGIGGGAPIPNLAELKKPFCVPVPATDGGVPDGGTQSLVKLGMDGGF